MRNPLELARSTAMKQHEKHAQGELRRELGVIVYNFDKKEQVLCEPGLLASRSTPSQIIAVWVMIPAIDHTIVLRSQTAEA